MNRRNKAGIKSTSTLIDVKKSKTLRVKKIKVEKDSPPLSSIAVNSSTKKKRKVKEEHQDSPRSSRIKTNVKKIVIKQENVESSNDPLKKSLSNKKVKLEDLPLDHKYSSSPNFLKTESKAKSSKYVGAHVSISGGLENAITNALAIGARAFGLFLTSQRTWTSKPLEEKTASKFREACLKHGFEPRFILPHGSYLLNCGAPNPEILEKSRLKLIDEMKRCEMLGLELYNFHPGSTCGEISVEKCIANISESINLALDKTNGVTAVIENMSCQGNTIGGKFSELRAIIDGVKDKSRVGVCLDTCHAFAAGYDVSTKEGFNSTLEEFDTLVGLSYLKAVHLNDSMGKLGCHLDRHENIGRGFIGKKGGFVHIMNDSRLDNLPLILETPANLSDEEEIKILYGYVK